MPKLHQTFSNFKEFLVTYKSTLKLVWQLDRATFIKITITNSLYGALVYPSLLISKLLIDAVMGAIVTRDVTGGLRMMILAAIGGLVIDRIQQVLQNIDRIQSRILSDTLSEKIQLGLSRKINLLPVLVAELPETRNLLQKVMDSSGRSIWSLINPISTFPEIVFTIISTAIPIIYFQPLIIIPCILLAIPNILVNIGSSKAWHSLSTEYSPRWRVYRALEDFAVKGKYLYENKILNHVETLLKRRLVMTTEYFNAQKEIDKKYTIQGQLLSIPLSLFQTGTRLYLYYLAIIQTITLGTAQITSTAIDRFIGNVSRLIRQASDIYQNYLFISDYESFMALPEENQQEGVPLSSTFSEGIEFRDVWFKYDQSPSWILKGVNFKVDPTENIAIVGENGAGKTTLIKLLCRFYEPQKGEILVNGQSIRNYSLKSYRHALSALFQDFAQYPFSAEDNIRFGDVEKKKTKKEIRQAAKLTGVADFIKSLPLGYKNPLDKEFEQGIEPSKGLWQRIALARILYRDAQIIILDEPTSNVDPESEEQIFADVLKVAKDKIIFLVSHRFSTVRKADKILVLENGLAVEYGSHSELMKLNGRYKELFSLQAQSYQ